MHPYLAIFRLIREQHPWRGILTSLWISLAVMACAIDDEDRCLDGYTYDPAVNQCRQDASAEACGTGPNVPAGLGEACSDDSGCTAFAGAPKCQNQNPMAQAYCTSVGCSPGGCPSCYQCCDCPAGKSAPSTICLTDSDAGLAVQFAGCSCS